MTNFDAKQCRQLMASMLIEGKYSLLIYVLVQAYQGCMVSLTVMFLLAKFSLCYILCFNRYAWILLQGNSQCLKSCLPPLKQNFSEDSVQLLVYIQKGFLSAVCM